MLDFVPKGQQDSARGFNPWRNVQTAPVVKGRKIFVIDHSFGRHLLICGPVLSPLQGGQIFIDTRG